MTSKRLASLNRMAAIRWAIQDGRRRGEIATSFGVSVKYVDLLKRKLRLAGTEKTGETR